MKTENTETEKMKAELLSYLIAGGKYAVELEAGKSYYNIETKCWFEAEECECCEKIVLGPNAVTANKQPPNTIATTIEPDEEQVYSEELGGCVCETCGNEALEGAA